MSLFPGRASVVAGRAGHLRAPDLVRGGAVLARRVRAGGGLRPPAPRQPRRPRGRARAAPGGR